MHYLKSEKVSQEKRTKGETSFYKGKAWQFKLNGAG